MRTSGLAFILLTALAAHAQDIRLMASKPMKASPMKGLTQKQEVEKVKAVVLAKNAKKAEKARTTRAANKVAAEAAAAAAAAKAAEATAAQSKAREERAKKRPDQAPKPKVPASTKKAVAKKPKMLTSTTSEVLSLPTMVMIGILVGSGVAFRVVRFCRHSATTVEQPLLA